MATEIDGMIVDLTGDGTGYNDMLKQAQDATKAAAENITKEAGKIWTAGQGLFGVMDTLSRGVSSLFSSRVFNQAAEALGFQKNVLEAVGAEVAVLKTGYESILPAIKELRYASLSVLAIAGNIFTPLGLAAAGVITVIGAVADRFREVKSEAEGEGGGGELSPFQRAFAAALQQGKAFLAWLQPFTDAVKSLFTGIKETATAGFRAVWAAGQDAFERVRVAAARARDYLNSVWNNVFGDASISWESIRDTAAGTITFIELILRNLGNIAGAVWDQAKAAWNAAAEALAPVGERVRQLIDLLRAWSAESSGIFASVARTAGTVAIAITAVYGAFKLLSFTIATVNGLLVSLGFYQAAVTIATGAWNLAVLAVSGTVAAFNLILGFYQGLLTANTVATAGWTLAAVAAKVITVAWSAALAVLNALLAPATILAVVTAVAALAVGFTVVYGIVMGLHGAVNAVWEVLSNLETTAGPIAHIGGLFGEWIGLLKEVIAAAQVDMPLAWQLLTAGATLAVAQLRALFPPLWEFLKEGFSALWDLIKEEFAIRVAKGITDVVAKTLQAVVVPVLDFFGATSFGENLQRNIDKINKEVVERSQKAREAAAQRLGQAAQGFKVEETDAILEAQQEIDRIREAIAEAEPKAKEAAKVAVPEIPPEAEEETKKQGRKLGRLLNEHVAKEVKLPEAIAASSAEAVARLAEFRERTREAGTGADERTRRAREAAEAGAEGGVVARAAGAGRGAVPAGGVPSTSQLATIELLKEIRDLLKTRAEQDPIVLVPAAFG